MTATVTELLLKLIDEEGEHMKDLWKYRCVTGMLLYLFTNVYET